MRRRRKTFSRLLLFFTSILTVTAFLLTILFFRLRPLLCTYARSQAETILLNAANQAVVNILQQEGITYDSIVALSRDPNGAITGLEINIKEINLLKSRISAEVARLSAKEDAYDLYIPFGTILGNEYTTGIGPRIRFSMRLTSTTVVDFDSHFSSAGINQVLHQILIKMKISGNILMIGCTDGVSAETSAIAAQTVIVGATPGSYTNVFDGEGNLTGDIFDYADLE